MACPKWTLSKNQPADLELALHSIDVVIGNENYFGKFIEIGGKEVVTYMDILKETAFEMNKKRWIFSTFFHWECLSYGLVYSAAQALILFLH